MTTHVDFWLGESWKVGELVKRLAQRRHRGSQRPEHRIDLTWVVNGAVARACTEHCLYFVSVSRWVFERGHLGLLGDGTL